MSGIARLRDTLNLNKAQIGSPIEDWLEAEGILQEATLSAAKKVITWRLSEKMRLKHIATVQMTGPMEVGQALPD